jgi:hypothetical protein
MAEIKSTLELVMQRTRHLSMSEEDKRKQAAKEFKDAVNRLALKYLDGQINLDRFQAEFSRLEAGTSGKAEAAAEIGRRIAPTADNSLVLDLIKHGLGYDISGIEAILKNFREKFHAVDGEAVDRIRADLLKKGIFGSAVVPSLETDKDRAKRIEEMLEAFSEELAEKIARLG